MTISAFAGSSFLGALTSGADVAGAPSLGDDARGGSGLPADGALAAFASMLSVALTPAPAPVPVPVPAGATLEAPPEHAGEEHAEAGDHPRGTPATPGEPATAHGPARAAASRVEHTSPARAESSLGSRPAAPSPASLGGAAEPSLGAYSGPTAGDSGPRRAHAGRDTSATLGRPSNETHVTESDHDASPDRLLAAAHARHSALLREPAAAPRAAVVTSAPAALDAPDASDARPSSDARTESPVSPAPAVAQQVGMNPALLGALLAVAPAHASASAPASTAVHASAARTASDAPASAARTTASAPASRFASRAATSMAAATDVAGATRATAAAPDNDLSSLDPEFRSRLERVITRMTGELGHTVEVVETYRDQSRQESLFAQGRSAPGPVVTWTRNSLHTLGRAADIRVDGGTEESAGYRDLRRVAEAEGLHTLGAKDPGHVEMPRSSGSRYAWTPPERDASSASLAPGAVMTRIVATGSGEADPAAPTVFSKRAPVMEAVSDDATAVAAPAPVARVASVAPVAQVAAVARVATPGAAPAAEPARRRLPNEAERKRAAATNATNAGHTASVDASDAVAAPSAGAARTDDPASVLAAVRADAARRVGRIMDLQDAAAPARVSSMTLTMDDATGGADRIRVDVRGRAVSAALSVAGTERAAELTGRADELRDALSKQGLQAHDVTVTAHAPTAAVATPDASRAASDRQAQQSAQQGAQQQQQQHNGPAAAHDQTSERGRNGRDADSDARGESREQSRRESTDQRHRARQGEQEKSAR